MNIPPQPRQSRWLYLLAIPITALVAFAGAALLWATGLQSVVVVSLRVLGVEAGPVPFIDLQAVLAAAQCRRLGFDVYLSNPCDVFGRIHVYSPLWLDVVPPMLGVAATPWAGTALILIVIAVVPLLIRPLRRRDVAIFAIAVFSPMTLYAVERANTDIVVFLLVLFAGLLQAGSRQRRIWSYALLVVAALLKYYPAILLALAARERRRDALVIAAGATAALVLFAACYRDDLGRALAIVARVSTDLSFYTDAFSARNLPYGIASGLPGLPGAPLGMVLFGLLLVVAVARVRRTVGLLDARESLEWTTEMRFAVVGGLLMTGCFFAAQNVYYRGIYLLFVLPGLVQWRDGTLNSTVRRFFSLMIVAVLFLMWGEFFRRGLLAAFDAQPGDRVALVFWVLRELVWWWLICGLAAIGVRYFAGLPLLRDGAELIDRLWPALGRKLRLAFKAGQSTGG